MILSNSSKEANVSNPDISIIIVNWNTVGLLDNCVRSIMPADYLTYEIIVVDNGSTDGSEELIASKYPHVRLIRNRKNLGFSRANNQGLRVSTGQYCLLLNSDTEILGDALLLMTQFLNAHADVGAVGSRLVNIDGSRQFSCGLAPLNGWQLWYQHLLNKIWQRNPFTKRARMEDWTYDVPFEVDWVGGAALMIRRQAIDQVGLLDEAFFMYVEDVEWCYRIRKQGWKIVYLPEATIYHVSQGSSQDPIGFAYHHGKTGYLLFHDKHYGKLSVISLRLFYAITGPNPRYL